MSLRSLSEFAFEELARARGDDIFRTARVSVQERGEDRVRYAVRGGDTYIVELIQIPAARELKVSCTCPHFLKVNFCKHIWASLRLADAQSHFPALAGLADLRFSFGGPLEGIEDAGQFDAADENSNGDDEDGPAPNEVAALLERSGQMANDKTTAGWREALTRIGDAPDGATATYTPRFPPRARHPRTAYFAIDLPKSRGEERLCLRFLSREVLKSGKPGVLKAVELGPKDIPAFGDPSDQAVLFELLGKGEPSSGYSYSSSRGSAGASLNGRHAVTVLEKIQATGRLCLIERRTGSYYTPRDRVEARPYQFSPTPFHFELRLTPEGEDFSLSGTLHSGDDVLQTDAVIASLAGLIFTANKVAALEPPGAATWLTTLGRSTPLKIAKGDLDEFLYEFFERERGVTMHLPESLAFTDTDDVTPHPRFVVQRSPRVGRLMARVEFNYGGVYTTRHRPGDFLIDPGQRRRVRRHRELENEHLEALKPLEDLFGPRANRERDHFEFAEGALLAIADQLLTKNWEMSAFERKLEVSSAINIEIKASSIDWFDLKAEVQFANARVDLPSLLANLREGKRFIELGDGSLGMIPEDWLKRYGHLSSVGKAQGASLRLNRVQALFLGASLEEHEGFSADKVFTDLRTMLKNTPELPKNALDDFRGELRPYQLEGAAWLNSLNQHGFGGILADDMGLGKTIQVLAHLSSLKEKGDHRPHLIVAPKSLVFNWRREIERFTPQFKTLTYTGKERFGQEGQIPKHDIVITTYATLRSDIEVLRANPFNYFVLDEAHYIKNPKSQACLAARLIPAARVLCLTGTPVENSMSDIFSLLSVTNPGLISPSRAQTLARGADHETTASLGRALRPFILRRTKAQVLTDLPDKMEQILYCELSAAERRRYDELKVYYWSQLSEKFSADGFKRARMEVLEALLRLRQAACHQGLLPASKSIMQSSKLDLLLEQIESVIQDGHKALVFSQFTQFLAKLTPALEERGIGFEYLDGKTKDREARVDRFQNDPEKKLFLLSLKAGGVGLNLTAADYVFILDPWWNPAVEAQAIDRAHRIGQAKQVFAYRLIAKDTVEEKILELQRTKRELAEALVASDAGPLKTLGMEDLRALFS